MSVLFLDVIATAIMGKLTCFDLEDLDLAYAPQYSSANDPIVIAGYIGKGKKKKILMVYY